MNQPMSVSDDMVISRMFGMVNPDTYSPKEYAESFGPIIETYLRNSPVKVASSALNPHGHGVDLTLVMERTFLVRPKRDINSISEVLHESGANSQQDLDSFASGLFGMGEKLTHITLVDSLGNHVRVTRDNVKKVSQNLNENKASNKLDLSALDESNPFDPAPQGGALNEDNVEKLRKIVDRRSMMPLKFSDGTMQVDLFTASAIVSAYDGAKPSTQEKLDMLLNANKAAFLKVQQIVFEGKYGDRNNLKEGRYDWDVDRMGHVTIYDKVTRDDIYIQGEDGQSLADELDNAPNERTQQMILDQYSTLFDESQKFIGETDQIQTAEKLLKDSEVSSLSGDTLTGYQSFLRRVITKKDNRHLMQHENEEIRNGAHKALRDLDDLAVAMS